ncbi:OmpH family outer membrane protein [uncultured Muriicola sp.]|uniref:OmpH family outer membrane protein n=1 Tax=uncultured Muriicola sp. TaxID=1583102 RepID=UPI0026358C29|nr:OmpH family outer membrane protein [uncultured Muriicola sp.]
MKKFFIATAILTAMACQQDKIAYVDNIRLMDGYKEKIAVEAQFTAQKETFNKKRDSISQVFQREAQGLEAQVKGMSQQKAQEAYAMLQQQGQRIGQELQQEEQLLQLQGQAEMDSVIQKVKKEIAAFGKAKGYTYILGGGEGGSVLYGADSKDVTDEVLAVLNKETQE